MTARLKVALDARRLQDRPHTGVGRGLANLVPLLATEVDLTLLTDGRRPPPEGVNCRVVAIPTPSHLPEPFWLQVSVARWLQRYDGIFHGSFNAVPVRWRGSSVVTLHDLSWEHHPEDLSPRQRFSFRTQARWSARHATAVLTVSEFIRGSIIDSYGLDPARVVVTPNAVDSGFSPDRAGDVAPLLERLGLTGRYLVALGGASRRGLDVALGAWRRAESGGVPISLVVVGSEKLPTEIGLFQAGSLTDDEWAALLAGAEAFCYPTRYEGFGMPALESAASGTPVVCARVGPLPEVLGQAAEWCASPTVTEVAAGLSRVLGDDARRSALRIAGLARAADAPTWADSAEAVLSAYRMAAG